MKFISRENDIQLMDDEVLVGFIEFSQEEDTLILEELYVYPGYRENGYGKIMCDEFIKFSQKLKKTIETDCWFFIEMYS